ncbi:hypothetical protein K1X12_08080 [Hyphomonas sp. WL0036]|uniref:hypothetical protein n=1 Tax=Hyphomonas sediminis TaxID=2866160 RepID=UPI001C7E1DAA|nr:hypothetical protein [Hyphomonas sediminis]MBY9066855.1 hypothetical protein [Hyphomonas sediminis]
MILLLAWLAAIASVVIAYIVAGPIWVRRHSLRFRVGKSVRRTSGAYGEMLLVSIGALMVWMIDSASPYASVEGIVSAHPMATLGVLVAVGLVVYIHGVRTALAADTGERARLMLTYLVYGVFSLIFFAGGAALIFLLVQQTTADAARLHVLAQAAIGNIPGPEVTGSDALMRGLELSYLDIQFMLQQAENSMTPVFVFMAGIFAINLAVRLTPLRSLFVNNAVLLTLVSTLIGLTAVIVVGTWTYVGSYASVITEYVGALEQFRSRTGLMKPEYVTRYSQITIEMMQQKSLLSFFSRISSEWGGIAAALGLAQWVAQQFNRPEAEESPSHGPINDNKEGEGI